MCAANARRLKYGIRRSLDGRVQLKRKNGVWMSVRLDMEVRHSGGSRACRQLLACMCRRASRLRATRCPAADARLAATCCCGGCQVPGAILLRDSKSSAVYALETDSLPQVRRVRDGRQGAQQAHACAHQARQRQRQWGPRAHRCQSRLLLLLLLLLPRLPLRTPTGGPV